MPHAITEIGQMPTVTRNAAGTLVLEVGTTAVQTLQSCTPPALVAEVITDRRSPSEIMGTKYIGAVGTGPATADFGIGMGKPMYEWIRKSFETGSCTQSGRFLTTSADNKVQSVLTFDDALLTSVTVPALDAAAMAAGIFTVEFDVGDTRDQKGNGTAYKLPGAGRQKAWLVSNFRISLPGLACSRVKSVDAFTWRAAVTKDDMGGRGVPVRRIQEVTVPDLTLTISSTDYDAWHTAATAWFIDGKRGDANEIDGSIELLSPDLKTVLATVGLKGVGFKRFERRGFVANAENVSVFKVQLYVEQLSFDMP